VDSVDEITQLAGVYEEDLALTVSELLIPLFHELLVC